MNGESDKSEENDPLSMESVLRAFTISFLLRSVFAGIFFVFSYDFVVSRCSTIEIKEIFEKSFLPVVLPMSLFAGVTVYGLHRSLFYPLVELYFASESGR